MDADIPATPTFVVNGEQVKASLLLNKIDAALQNAGE
jgi:protein-disulfide isomerase